MTPKELHEECMEACLQCDPSYYNFDDDQNFRGHGQFSKIPKKGHYAVIQFWREYGTPLWEHGYDEALSEEAKQIFAGIDKVIAKAIKKYVSEL